VRVPFHLYTKQGVWCGLSILYILLLPFPLPLAFLISVPLSPLYSANSTIAAVHKHLHWNMFFGHILINLTVAKGHIDVATSDFLFRLDLLLLLLLFVSLCANLTHITCSLLALHHEHQHYTRSGACYLVHSSSSPPHTPASQRSSSPQGTATVGATAELAAV